MLSKEDRLVGNIIILENDTSNLVFKKADINYDIYDIIVDK